MIIFGYNFKHWKTEVGLISMVTNGFVPELVVLQNKKDLTVPHSNYRISPNDEYLLHPVNICNTLGLKYVVMDHNDYEGSKNLGVILGARILSKEIIERMPKGILNIHPGILPGNRGLDNLKHSIAKRLPIGVTAHLIDSRIDMGIILDTKIVPIFKDDTIRDVFIRQRGYEQKLLIEVLKADKWNGKLCQHSEKFSAVDEATDTNIHNLFNTYKKYHYESISLSTDLRG